jgi:hypothetical protein
LSSGVHGGILLTIDGNGFAESIIEPRVTIGSSACSIVDSTPEHIQCLVPAQGSTPSSANIAIVSNGITFPGSFTFTYNAGITPTISSISPTTGVAGQILTITGSNFIVGQTSVSVGGINCPTTSISTSSIVCTVNATPAGNQPVIVRVASTGTSNSNIQFQYILQVNSISPAQGGYGGGQTVSIVGDGFNGSSTSVTICGRTCQSISMQSNTQLSCLTPVAPLSSSDQSCSLIVTVGSSSRTVSYTYRANLTATVTAISPTRGGTGGGTTLTITGTNFP